MKRLLILLIALMCITPLASATVHTWSVGQSNENEGVRTNLVILRSNQANISSIQSLTIQGCNPYFGHNPSYDRAGTFELKNQTNVTLATGVYSSQYEDVANPYCPYAGTIWHEYTFNNYSNPYGLVDTWKIYYSNGIGYYGDGAVTDAEPWKSTFLPRDQPSPIAGGYTFTYIAGDEPPPAANFNATPQSGTAPLYVMFDDNSTNELGTCTYNWTITPITGVSGATGTLENHLATFTIDGNYTVAHGVECYGKSDIETKTDYIMVLNGSVLGTLYITAINSLNGYPIQGATLNLNDVENGTWVNATTTTGTSQITGIKTHTVNVYASSPGFANNDKLGIPISNVYDSILMFPENRSNVSAGNVTLFVSVYEGDEHSKPIPNAGVNVIGPGGGSGQYTNSGGTAQFTVANKTTYLVDVQASGHRGATASVYSGTGSGGSASVTVTVYLDKNTVTPTVTQTTLPGGGTPTPTVTVLPGCELDPSSPECQASQNNEAMAWISANGLGLVQFFVLCFIVFMVKGMGKR